MDTEGCYHVFTTVIIATMYMGVQVFLWCIHFILENKIKWEIRSLGHMVTLSLILDPIFNPPIVFFTMPIYILTRNVWRFPFL